MNIKKLCKLRKKRAMRIRYTLKKRAGGDRQRLTVFRSNNHIYCQIIDLRTGNVLATSSTLEVDLRKPEIRGKGKIACAEIVGKQIAARALEKGIIKVFFDRSWYAYHGRVLSLAKAAREGGLIF